MPEPLLIRIMLGTWGQLRDDASGVRHAVFVVEQSVPEKIELDDDDAVSVHAVAYEPHGTPIATGRLLPDGHIGRMAVRQSVRGMGVGGRILNALIARGRADGHRVLRLNAQTHARRFYEAHGFTAEGDVFMDAGIAHIGMRRALCTLF